LTSISLPSCLKSIGSNAFGGCTALKNIEVRTALSSDYEEYYASLDGVLYSADFKNIICIPAAKTELTIDYISEISYGMFENNTLLKKVTIGNSVSRISSRAFYGCKNLISITIGNGVTSIGNEAFENTAYYDNESNWVNGVLYMGKHLIKARNTISGTYTVNKSTLSIADSAFKYCSNLTKIVLPNELKEIGYMTFDRCSSLKDIKIPNTVTSIGGYAFRRCGFTSIDIPESVTSIGEYAFYGCSSLTSIEMPDSVTSIGNEAFENTAYYKDESNWVNGVLYIGRHLIKVKNTGLETYAIESGTLTIAEYAFYGCDSIVSIEIPGSVTSIGGRAFSGCRSLTSVGIPNSVTSIGESAFNGCTSLSIIKIPRSVKSIGKFAFYADLLPTITIYCEVDTCPEGWDSEWNGNYQFGHNPTVWNCENNDKDESGYAYTVVDGIIYKLKDGEAKLLYQSSNISGAVTILSSVYYRGETYDITSIQYLAFREGLTSIVIPNSVTRIGSQAFYECSNLTSVYYSGSAEEWKSIYKGEGNKNLTSATIYYHSESAPQDAGNYWHYDENGEIIVW
ncbi:MAG: leucine-rich repeat domain-containing protein, partial [Clostridiales bacterium]|nr:leucine-rich repeat domain-containing protein [Clostridiales bacterium]